MVEIKTYGVVVFVYFQKHKIRKLSSVSLKENSAKNVPKKISSQDIEEQINESRISNQRNRRLNSIFQMCLEPHNTGDYLSLKSPKNFCVHYFMVSRNQPVKVCRRSQCPFTAGPEKRKQEVQRPKRNEIIGQDRFSQCANFPKKIDKAIADPTTCSNSFEKVKNSNLQDHGVPCCSSTSSSSSCCSSKTFDIDSSRVKKRHILLQTDPEQSWQTKCSNFIINLPVTLSEKFFGPREQTICNDDSRMNRSRPLPNNTSKTSSKGQRKKSGQLRTSSLADRGCQKNVGTEKFFIEKANQVDPCYLKTFQSVQEDGPCGKSVLKSERSTVTCKKGTYKCEDSFSRSEISENYSRSIHSRGSDPADESRLKCGRRNDTNSSIPEGSKREKSSPRFSNWPAILSEKFFGPRNEKVFMVDNEVTSAKGTDGITDGRKIVSEGCSSSSAKKRRLSLKKYTISKTPEAMEETLCFDIISGKQLTETRSKLQSQICVRTINDNQQKLETIQERNEAFNKFAPKRRVRSKGNSSKSKPRKRRQLDKETSTEHIFLSSLITKLLNLHRDDKDVCKDKKCHRNTASGHNGNERDQNERKCALKHRTDTVSRKYATTSIHKHRNKSVKCARCVGKDSRKDDIDCRNVSDEEQNGKKNSNDFLSGGEEVSEQVITRTNLIEDDLEDEDEGVDSKKKVTRDREDKLKLSKEKENQGCESCESSKIKRLVKSGAVQVIDRSSLQESRELCCIVLHQEKRKAKSNLGEKSCKKILSQKKFPCRVRRRNEIEFNELKSACRGRRDGELMSHRRNEICTQRHLGRISKKISHGEEIPESKICERLIIKENEIPKSANDRTSQFSVGGIQRTFLIDEENICVKLHHDRETCTDDLPGPAHCQSSRYTGNVIENSEGQRLNREGSSLEENGNDSMQKQTENAMRIEVDPEECGIGSPRENDACWKRPMRMSKGEDILEPEEDVGKIFRSEERGNAVCGGKMCVDKAFTESERKEESGIFEEGAEFRGEKNSLKDHDCSVDEDRVKNYSTNDSRYKKSEELDEVDPKIDGSGKGNSGIRSPGKDLDVTRPESRNIINSYYSQSRSLVTSKRSETRNNEHAKVKKGKVAQGNGTALERSITKARKPFQRIENVRQAGYSANVVIKNDKGEKRDAVEKENSIASKKILHTLDGSVFGNDAKDYLVQNVAIADHALSIKKLQKETDSVDPGTRVPASKIPKKSRPLITAHTRKAPEISSARLKESLGKSLLKKGNSETVSGRKDTKQRRGKEAEKIAENAGSECSNRLTKSIDTRDTKGSEKRKEVLSPAYIFDKENLMARTLRIEMSSVEDRKIGNVTAIGKGNSWIAEGRGSGKSSKSASLQRNELQKESDKSLNIASRKEMRENKERKRNESKPEIARKKNENDKESTPLKLLSQIDSEIDARSSATQERVAITNANSFSGTLIDGKNNIKSYSRDLQSVVEGNSNSNRISASKDEGLPKSSAAAVQSKSKVLKSTESNKTRAKKVLEKSSKNNEKSKNFKEKETADISHEDKTENTIKTYPGSFHIENKNDLNRIGTSTNNSESWRPSICKNNGNRERNFRLRSSSRNSNESEDLEAQDSLASKSDERRNNFNGSCALDRIAKNAALKKKCEDFQNFGNEEKKGISRVNYNFADEETTSCTTSGKIINDSSDRNFSFTDDLKRFLDQGQEFFASKMRKNCNEKTSCDSGKSNESEANCKKSEFCKSFDYQKLNRICDEDNASNNSISSLRKAYSTLKTILNKTKNVEKFFTNAKQTKETQIYTPIVDESSIKTLENGKSLDSKISEGNESLTVSMSFGSSILGNPNLAKCNEKNNKI